MPLKPHLNASREPLVGWVVHTHPLGLKGRVRANLGVFDNLGFFGGNFRREDLGFSSPLMEVDNMKKLLTNKLSIPCMISKNQR